jgi:hypothetical protein
MNRNPLPIRIWALTLLAMAGPFAGRAQQSRPADPRDFEAFRIITDRNIFDVNRRPPVARGTPRQAPAIVDTFTLTGTMSYESGLFAVFDGSSSEYHKVMGPGGKIAGYTIAEIAHEFVKLSAGTNEVELRVGIQMRRSEDGKWSVGGRTETAYASTSESRSRGSGRFDRNDRNDRRSGSPSNRFDFRRSAGPGDAGGNRASPPVDTANLDPNDAVARLMLRRLQEAGGNINPSENGAAVDNPDVVVEIQPVEPNGPVENPNQRTNGGDETGVPARNGPPDNRGRNRNE